MDYEKAPAPEFAALYCERWEIEIALDKLKTHLRGNKVVLRRKTPDLVRQEFYGLMLTHFAVRSLMHEAALEADIDPDRLSFLHTVRVVRRKLPRFTAAFSPRALRQLHMEVIEEILEVRLPLRAGRKNLRGVKRKMSGFPVRTRNMMKHALKKSKFQVILILK